MLLSLAVFVLTAPVVVEPEPVVLVEANYRSERVNSVLCHIIEASISRVRIEIVVPPGFPEAEESFDSMIARSEPFAAINGTYFDTKTFRPIGDIVSRGQRLHDGRMGTVLAITEDDVADIGRVPWGRTQNWDGYSSVLGCGPALMLDGAIDIDPTGERFQSDKVTMKTLRNGIGITLDGRIFLVQTRGSVDLPGLADIFLTLGCHEAMNLDAGASLAFYVDGRTLVRPSRKLTNVLVLYKRTSPEIEISVSRAGID